MNKKVLITVIVLLTAISQVLNASVFFKNDSLRDNTSSNQDTTLISDKNQKPLTRILFIFDSSQSMLGRWDGRRKIDIARNLLKEMLDSLSTIDNLQIGLRVYGHQKPVPPQDCSDTKLEVPFEYDNIDKIKYVLDGLVAKGTTPIALSLEKGAYDFPGNHNSRNIIVLITDGIEACEGDPCAVSLALQEKGVILKPFIIGLGLDVKVKDAFECVGFYFDATNSREFKHALDAVVDQVLNFTSAQVNLLDSNGKPEETNVVMSFHDELSGDIRYNYVHTMNENDNPDTVLLDIMTRYDLVVHTIPPVSKDSIELEPGTHNIIELPAPQGFINFSVPGDKYTYENIKCIVRKNDNMKTLNVQNANTVKKYITGNYDVEILSRPRINIKDVKVEQYKVNKVMIPEPGELKVNFDRHPIGSIIHEEGDKQKKVFTLDPYKKNYEILLQPGQYRLVYRYAKDNETKNTVEKQFNIRSGKTLIVKTK